MKTVNLNNDISARPVGWAEQWMADAVAAGKRLEHGHRLPCNPGDFAGRHESILREDGTWTWAVAGNQ